MPVEARNLEATAGLKPGDNTAVELTIVMPCLNEAETLAMCIRKAQRSLNELNLTGEIVVADNGSTDGSQEIARQMGASLVPVEERGYGTALIGASAAARGPYV